MMDEGVEVKEERRGGGSKLGSDLDMDPDPDTIFKTLRIFFVQNVYIFFTNNPHFLPFHSQNQVRSQLEMMGVIHKIIEIIT